jgi:hydrogenase maturation protease
VSELPETGTCKKPEIALLLEAVQQLLKNHRVLFVGVGNVLKKDDGVGVYICRHLEKISAIHCLVVEASLEKFIGKINSLDPEILILVDCMYFPRKNPGYFEFLSISRIMRYAVHTHHISLGNIADFFSMPVYILGIHPEHVNFGENLSASVKGAADKIIEEISQAFEL